ncbi:hypothetical protein N473_11785 [Pseudoalteromonas luteoviolacea CPMOR-1]|uniref:Uncharacterized protein n=1 Tax=Pseudoalteromonas luteoviolacea CPMOR-1 TaxID=1365248 RepID=A0A161YTL6_9GAMM|nr:hypothetical protein [Pseudoalteromonas luteoviolacea]KZN65700.1 hypothetical protein N473_11785 [Pseudoalteromonas luteoviolacea CPMOR-1]
MKGSFLIKFCSLYKSWDEHSVSKWKSQEKRGMLNFVLVEGILKWGLISSAAFFVLIVSGKEIAASRTLIASAIWLVLSIVYGISIWFGTSLSYKNWINNKL